MLFLWPMEMLKRSKCTKLRASICVWLCILPFGYGRILPKESKKKNTKLVYETRNNNPHRTVNFSFQLLNSVKYLPFYFRFKFSQKRNRNSSSRERCVINVLKPNSCCSARTKTGLKFIILAMGTWWWLFKRNRASKRNTVMLVRTKTKPPPKIRGRRRRKKKRVNLTFINEHCSRMSILLNMGHTKPFDNGMWTH